MRLWPRQRAPTFSIDKLSFLEFEGVSFGVKPGETVLECLERNGQVVKSGCRSGACQSCLLRSEDSAPPAAAQSGLSRTLKRQNYFLSCVAKATDVAKAAPPGESAVTTTRAILSERTWIHDDVIHLRLLPDTTLAFEHGMFLRMTRSDGLGRSYSIANSALTPDSKLCFHVRVIPEGRMSQYLAHQAAIGESFTLEGPFGACTYDPRYDGSPMLMIASGTGLAPILSIATDALARGHQAPIHLYFGGVRAEALYGRDSLRELTSRFEQFHVHTCIDEGAEVEDRIGTPIDLALSDHPDLSSWKVFAAGHPMLVKKSQKKAYLAGASLQEIHCDPFEDQLS